jgi:hypothetical protein
MKKLIVLFSLGVSFSLFAQVEIDNTVYLSTGAVMYIGPATNVNVNGKIESEGASIVFNQEITGDDKIDLDENTNVEIVNGTLTFQNELDEEINNLTLQSSGVVEVEPGSTLLLNGDLNNSNSGVGLKLLADAADAYSMLLVEGAQSGSGEVLSEIYLSGASGWKYIGAPVNTNFLDLAANGHSMVAAPHPTGNVFYWDATTAQWAFPSSVNDNFEQGKGYNIFMGSSAGATFVSDLPGEVDLEGQLFSNGNVVKTLDYNDGQTSTENFVGGTTLTHTQGWNMLANPYPCAYDLTGQSIPAGMNDAYYIWNTNGGVAGQFTQFINGVGVNGAVPYLSPYQAFFVQTTSNAPGSFTFSASQRLVTQNPAHLKTSTMNNHMRLKVFSSSDVNNSDENYLEFEANSNDEFDLDWDAREMQNGNGVPNLFYVIDEDEFAINRMAIFRNGKTVPVHFRCDNSGKYEIDADLFGMDYSWSIELEDLQTGFMHDLRKGPVPFEHVSSNLENRFLLHINGGDDEYFTANSRRVKIYSNQNNVIIKVRGQEMAVKNVSVYDLSGRLIVETEMERDQTEMTLPVSIKDRSVFMVVFKSSHFTVAEKVLLHQ